jgi:D-methionine transport system permease protein
MSPTILLLLLKASLQTLYMIFTSGFFAALAGIPLGILLCVSRKNHIWENNWINRISNFFVNITRALPFIILLIALIPLTRFLVGTSIGTNAAIVPLTFAAIPFVARVIENALLEVNNGLIEAALAFGATPIQTIQKVLLPEALPSIINGLTLTLVTLIGYSAMAGAIGAGGLGDVAIRYGYQRFDWGVMFATIIIMIVLVQAIQYGGDSLVRKISRCK